MTGSEVALVGGGAAIAYALSQGGSPANLAAPVPSGTTITVSVNGFDTFTNLTFSAVNAGNPLASRFENQIQNDGAGYVVLSWNVTESALTSALLNNQEPYSGTFVIQTTTAFGQLLEIQNSIAGEFYAATGYLPTVNVSGGSAGTPSVGVNVSGIGSFLTSLTANLGNATVLILVGLAVLIWVERDNLVKAIP
jgi:hypothetical protein